jgi:Predicted tRNA(5-methylaminomethyl-2-thiouridylate) methyltransferase, contains the PP-loop ATPase domain
MPDKPIAVAMSGGVDSSVVAGMLQARGENVIGLTMQLWNQRRLPEIQSDKAPGDAVHWMTCTTRAQSRRS